LTFKIVYMDTIYAYTNYESRKRRP
jgi:hypothetical protein